MECKRLRLPNEWEIATNIGREFLKVFRPLLDETMNATIGEARQCFKRYQDLLLLIPDMISQSSLVEYPFYWRIKGLCEEFRRFSEESLGEDGILNYRDEINLINCLIILATPMHDLHESFQQTETELNEIWKGSSHPLCCNLQSKLKKQHYAIFDRCRQGKRLPLAELNEIIRSLECLVNNSRQMRKLCDQIYEMILNTPNEKTMETHRQVYYQMLDQIGDGRIFSPKEQKRILQSFQEGNDLIIQRLFSQQQPLPPSPAKPKNRILKQSPRLPVSYLQRRPVLFKPTLPPRQRWKN
jgi:hypothetical protein